MQRMEQIETLIEPLLEDMGYDLVRVVMIGNDDDKTLQIMAERTEDGGMDVDDCAKISYEISALLDVEDPISGAYRLEVSSPGLDRPLVKLVDFERFAGFVAKIETKFLIDNRKRYKGKVLGTTEDNKIKIDIDGTEYEIDIDAVEKAKLVITDELLKAASQG